MYAMVETRPNIAYALSILSRFYSNPYKTHETAAKHVLRYLKGNLHIDITYGGTDELIGYTDADWAGDQDTRRSTGGYLFTLYGDAISWQSKRQAIVALSSCEAEYMAQTQATKKAIWIRQLIKELDLDGSLMLTIRVLLLLARPPNFTHERSTLPSSGISYANRSSSKP